MMTLFPSKYWMKHTPMVPKGFLRYQVLKQLNEKPMSGSEIMTEIEKQTYGSWKPSPGSIYPLLAWLRDEGYIKETAEKEVGIKRYMITEQGRSFLEEHVKMSEERHKRFRHFGPGPNFMGPMWFEFYPKKAKELQRATKDFAIVLWNLRDRLRQEYSEKAAEEAKIVLEGASKKIKDITKEIGSQ